MEEQERIIQKLKEYFSRKDDVTLALLFGSFAKGTQAPHSDVDIAVEYSAETDDERLEKWLTMRSELELLVGRDIDLLDLQKCDGLILSEVMGKHVRLKHDVHRFAQYLLKSIYFNEDWLPVLREMRKKKLARFING